jgi:hypothetical protein
MTDKVEMCHTAQAMSLCMITSVYITCGHLVPWKLMDCLHDSPVSLVRKLLTKLAVAQALWTWFHSQWNVVLPVLSTIQISSLTAEVVKGKIYKYTTTSSDGSRKALLQMWCAGRWAIMTKAHMDQSSKRLDSTAYSIHNSKFRFKQGNNSLLIFAILPTALLHL